MAGPTTTFGQRLRAHRERAGMTRAVLGGLVGRSEQWVKDLETGRRLMPRLPMLLRLTEALRLDDVAELAGDQSTPVTTLAYGEHPAVPAIRAAIQHYTLTRPSGPTVPATVLRARVAQAWQVWHQSRTRRTDVGALLPALITDGQLAAADDGPDRRAAHAALTDVYALAQHALVHAAVPELQWLVVERALAAAQVADEPAALAGAAWTVGMMLRQDGRSDEALTLVDEAASLLERYLPDADDDWLGMWAALQLHAATTVARAGRDGPAWARWDSADAAVRRLPDGYAHPWTMAGSANIDLTAVSLTVDMWRSREALRRAERIDPDRIPSRERRGRYWVELARGYAAGRDLAAAAGLLVRACDEGVDAVRYSPAARSIVDVLVARPPRAVRPLVRDLAVRLGLDPP